MSDVIKTIISVFVNFVRPSSLFSFGETALSVWFIPSLIIISSERATYLCTGCNFQSIVFILNSHSLKQSF